MFLPSFILVQTFGLLLGVELVVKLEEAFQDFFPDVGVDGVTDAVVFGEVVHFVEVVAEGEGWAGVAGLMPAVGGEDGLIHSHMQLAELQKIGVGGFGYGKGLLAFLGHEFDRQVAVVEQVVGLGQPQLQLKHQFAPVVVVTLADLFQFGIR